MKAADFSDLEVTNPLKFSKNYTQNTTQNIFINLRRLTIVNAWPELWLITDQKVQTVRGNGIASCRYWRDVQFGKQISWATECLIKWLQS